MKLKLLLVCAILASFGMMAQDADQGSASLPAAKAIDMEHHFYVPSFIDYTKARTDYPKWQKGIGMV